MVAISTIAPLQWTVGRLAFSGDALVSALYVLGFACAITVGNAANPLSRSPNLSELLRLAVVAAGVLSSGIALNQTFEVGGLNLWAQDLRPGGRAFGNLGQPNNFGTLMGLAVVGVLGLREFGRLSALSTFVLVTPLVLGAAASQSRTALVFGPAVALGIWWCGRHGLPFKTRVRTVLVGAVCQIVLTVNVLPWLRSTLLLLSEEPTIAEKGLGSLRYPVWKMLGDALFLKPWTGYGWLQVSEAQLAVTNEHPPVGEMWAQAHDIALDLLLWCGIPLGSVLVLGIGYWLVSRGRRIATPASMLAYLSVVIVLLHSLLEFPYQYAYFLIPVGLWIGIVEQSHRARAWLPGICTAVPVVLAVVLLIGVCRDYPAVEEEFRQVRFETLRIGRIRPAAPSIDAPFLSSLTAFLSFETMEIRAGATSEQMARSAEVVKRFPYAWILARYGRLLALNDRLDDAVQAYEAIRHLYPLPLYVRLVAELSGRVDAGEAGLRPLLNRVRRGGKLG